MRTDAGVWFAGTAVVAVLAGLLIAATAGDPWGLVVLCVGLAFSLVGVTIAGRRLWRLRAQRRR